MKIILLVGLPGSGKTTYGKSLGFPFCDDLSQNGGIIALREVDPATETLIISDHSLIYPKSRKAFESILDRIFLVTEPFEYVIWDNNPEACYQNILRRDDGRIISSPALQQMSKEYIYPYKVTPRPVNYEV
jgi:tRNA uridine 5-carbamoylmethylation protein Kti12